MSNNKLALWESLVRLSFIIIFLFALTVGTYGIVSICHTFMHNEITRPEFITRDLS